MAGDVVFNNATVTVTVAVAAINVYGNAEVLQRLDVLAAQLALQGVQEMATLDELVQAAHDEETVDDSIVALVTALKASVDAQTAGTLSAAQQAKVDEAFAAVTNNSKKIGDAVVANTPAADTGSTGDTGTGTTTGG